MSANDENVQLIDLIGRQGYDNSGEPMPFTNHPAVLWTFTLTFLVRELQNNFNPRTDARPRTTTPTPTPPSLGRDLINKLWSCRFFRGYSFLSDSMFGSE